MDLSRFDPDLALLLASLSRREGDVDRVLWFEPTFHAACGLLLRSESRAGMGEALCTLRCTFHRDGGPRYDWLSPLTSAEPVALSRADYDRLVGTFDAAVDAPPQTDWCVRDGCRCTAIRAHADRITLAEQNPPEGAMRALVDLALALVWERSRWHATRRVFGCIPAYL